jgi:hypothetical protein
MVDQRKLQCSNHQKNNFNYINNQNRMDLIYTTTSKDYLALLNRILNHSVFGKNFSKYTWIAISLLAWLSVILPFVKFQEFGIGFWTRIILALIITIGWPFFYDKYTDGVFSGILNDKTLARYAGKVSINISKEYIEAKTETTTSKTKWDNLHMVEINESYIFIFFTPIIVTPIPTTVFKNLVEQNEFIKEIEKYMKPGDSNKIVNTSEGKLKSINERK